MADNFQKNESDEMDYNYENWCKYLMIKQKYLIQLMKMESDHMNS